MALSYCPTCPTTFYAYKRRIIRARAARVRAMRAYVRAGVRKVGQWDSPSSDGALRCPASKNEAGQSRTVGQRPAKSGRPPQQDFCDGRVGQVEPAVILAFATSACCPFHRVRHVVIRVMQAHHPLDGRRKVLVHDQLNVRRAIQRTPSPRRGASQVSLVAISIAITLLPPLAFPAEPTPFGGCNSAAQVRSISSIGLIKMRPPSASAVPSTTAAARSPTVAPATYRMRVDVCAASPAGA